MFKKIAVASSCLLFAGAMAFATPRADSAHAAAKSKAGFSRFLAYEKAHSQNKSTQSTDTAGRTYEQCMAACRSFGGDFVSCDQYCAANSAEEMSE